MMNIKQRIWTGATLFLLLSTALAACGPAAMPAASTPAATYTLVTESATKTPIMESATYTPAPGIVTDTPDAAQTPVPMGDVEEYTNENFGFSLSYPKGYEAQNSIYHTVVFLAPQGTQGHRERAFLSVELALDQTAEWFANQMKEQNEGFGTDITTSVRDIDGQQAYILGHLPGQDINRQVFVVYKGILYHLTFMPDHPGEAEANRQMETLYSAVMSSLRFLPERREVPPVLSTYIMANQIERAVEAHSADDIIRPIGDKFMILEWLYPGVTQVELGRNEAYQELVDKHFAATPDIMIQEEGWPDVAGSPFQFTGYFPEETVIPVQVQGWGPEGSDEAVLIFGRWSDGSLYWRGVLFAPQGPFEQ